MEAPFNEDNSKEGKTKSGFLAFLLLFAAVIAVAFLAYVKSNNIDIKNIGVKDFIEVFSGTGRNSSAQVLGEITYETKEAPAFSANNGYLVKCTGEYIKWFNSQGIEEASAHVTMSKPLLRSVGDYLLLVDQEGKGVYFFEGKTEKWNEKTENPIMNAELNEDGFATLIEKGSGYKAVVSILDRQGKEVFKKSVSESFVISAKVSPSGKHIVLNRLDTAGINAVSSLEFDNIEDGKPFDEVPAESSLFPYMWYLNDGELLIASDTQVKCYGKDRKEVWRKDNLSILSSVPILDKFAAVAVSGASSGKGRSKVLVYDKSGKQITEYGVEGEVKSLDAEGDIIAINEGSLISFITSKGKYINSYKAKSDILKVFFLNKNEAAIIMKTGVQIIEI